jgi:hypothetical protein
VGTLLTPTHPHSHPPLPTPSDPYNPEKCGHLQPTLQGWRPGAGRARGAHEGTRSVGSSICRHTGTNTEATCLRSPAPPPPTLHPQALFSPGLITIVAVVRLHAPSMGKRPRGPGNMDTRGRGRQRGGWALDKANRNAKGRGGGLEGLEGQGGQLHASAGNLRRKPRSPAISHGLDSRTRDKPPDIQRREPLRSSPKGACKPQKKPLQCRSIADRATGCSCSSTQSKRKVHKFDPSARTDGHDTAAHVATTAHSSATRNMENASRFAGYLPGYLIYETTLVSWYPKLVPYGRDWHASSPALS